MLQVVKSSRLHTQIGFYKYRIIRSLLLNESHHFITLHYYIARMTLYSPSFTCTSIRLSVTIYVLYNQRSSIHFSLVSGMFSLSLSLSLSSRPKHSVVNFSIRMCVPFLQGQKGRSLVGFRFVLPATSVHDASFSRILANVRTDEIYFCTSKKSMTYR